MTRSACADFQYAVRPLLPNLRASATRLTRNASEADDLLQDTLTRGWLFWARFEAGSNLGAWLRRIMLNLYVSRYKRTKRAHAVLQNVVVFAEQAAQSMRENLEPPTRLREALIASLAALPTGQREMFWAVYACDMSYQQAAVTFACPVGTVMSRLHRTRRSLQRSLESVAADHGLSAATAVARAHKHARGEASEPQATRDCG